MLSPEEKIELKRLVDMRKREHLLDKCGINCSKVDEHAAEVRNAYRKRTGR